MSLFNDFEDYTKHYMYEHSLGDLLSALQVPIALIALALLFILN